MESAAAICNGPPLAGLSSCTAWRAWEAVFRSCSANGRKILPCAERAAQGWERTTRPRGWSVLAWGKHSRRRSACRPVLQQNSGDLRGTLLVRSDDFLTFLGISAVRTLHRRSSRGDHEHYFRQLFRGGIPPEPTV